MTLSRILACVFLAACCAASMGSGCQTGSSPFTGGDCGYQKEVCTLKTIQPGLINGQSDFFEFETPEARNDCEAEYAFAFRWAEPAKRLVDSDMPPLEDLAHAFQPGGEFGYFPHPAAVFVPLQYNDCSGFPIDGVGWWTITFNIGNKNSSLPTTRYYVRARLDPALATTGDDTEIFCRIRYFNKPKQN